MSDASLEGRLISLDVFRGMTIAGMVLVNNPGTWSAIYGPLKHAEWHGITPTDYIFPFFLFIVGVAMPVALSRRIAEGVTRDVYVKILSRSAAIFAAGLAISALPLFDINKTTTPAFFKWVAVLAVIAALFFLFARKFKIALALIGVWAMVLIVSQLAGYEIIPYHFGGMRIPGVLQRIAVCYLVASLIFLHTSWKQLAAIGAAMLLIYWWLMTAVPVPGCEVTSIDDKACNLAAYIDRLILTEAHIWRAGKVYDPEGILSTIPAVVTTLAGVLAGTWLRQEREPADKVNGLFFFGVMLLAAGWTWSLVFPLNKALWTSSYVVYTAGLALLTLAACYWLIDIKGYRRWAFPFVVFGVNALGLFVFSGIFARMLNIIRFGPEGEQITLQKLIFQNVFLSLGSPLTTSLLYALTFILFWWFLMWLLYRKKLFLKV
ncbi:MAG: DUF5009 domain-containing protein [Blastocatellia bacterium]|nr:DUF5009 domain-containing protein [Blastocatellia bacterium]